MFFVPSVTSGLSGNLSDYPEGIVLAVDKPYRWTSADVIRKLKYAAIRHFGKKNLKVGHAGTLDPLATGVLLVCIGPACKCAQALQDHDKEYIARIRFGATTPSYDLEKEVDRRFPFEQISREAVAAVLPSFLGEQEQVAPLFSAKSVDGVRAYELARKLYKAHLAASVVPDCERESQFDTAALETLHRSRIVISELELLDYTVASSEGVVVPESSLRDPSHPSDGPLPLMEPRVATDSGTTTPSGNAAEGRSTASTRIHVADTSGLGLPEATVRIACSKGTYIRAFARDLGEALGSGAHLSGLIRSRSGQFTIKDALRLEDALNLFQH